MIRRMIFLCVAAASVTAFLPSQASAQSVVVMAGGAFPTSDFGDAYDTGWMVAGGLKLPLGPGGFWFGIEGSYGEHGTDVDGVNANPIGAMAKVGLDIPVPGGLNPYVFVGGGLLALKTSEGDTSDTVSKFGYQAGGGFDLGSGLVSPFIEVRYEGSEDIDFFGANVGLSIGLN
jgi:opacity protein-like surface antigen